MAIKVQNTTVVDDGRNLLNIRNASFSGDITTSANSNFASGTAYVDSVNSLFLVGSTTAYQTRYAGSSTFGQTSYSSLQILGAGQNGIRGLFANYGTGTVGARVQLAKSKSNTIGVHTAVADSDTLGELQFMGSDGSEFIIGSSIKSDVDGTVTANNIPSSISFRTVSQGNGSVLGLRMIIAANGNIGMGTQTPSNKLDVSGNIALTGGIVANNSLGTSGQVLTSTGTGVVWSTVSGGGGGGSTNLSDTANSSTVTIFSDTGTDAIVTEANTTTAGVLTAVSQTIAGHKKFANTVSVGIDQFASGTLTVGGKFYSRDMNILYATGSSGAGMAKMWVDGSSLTFGLTGPTGSTGQGFSIPVNYAYKIVGGAASYGGDEGTAIGHRWNTNGLEAMRIDSAGDVGIGTTNPLEKLHANGNIYSTGQILGNYNDSNTAPAFTWYSDTNTGMYHPANDTISFVTAGTDRLRINNNGTVMIGANTYVDPNYKLVVDAGSTLFTKRVDMKGSMYAEDRNEGGTSSTLGAYIYSDRTQLTDQSFSGARGLDIGTVITAVSSNNVNSLGGALGIYNSIYATTNAGRSIDVVRGNLTELTQGSNTLVKNGIAYDATGTGRYLNYYGFRQINDSFLSANAAYGFYSDIRSGANSYNFYSTSSAKNYFGGDVQFGGRISANNSYGTSGQVLTSTGTGIVWSTASSGSSVVANTTTAGIVSTTTQSFAGNKTFTGTVGVGVSPDVNWSGPSVVETKGGSLWGFSSDVNIGQNLVWDGIQYAYKGTGFASNYKQTNGNHYWYTSTVDGSPGQSIPFDVRMTLDSGGTLYVSGNVAITGALTATTKSFLINHPTKSNMKLQYVSLEGPENGVYVRGRLKGKSYIELPDYWTGLVDETSVSVNLTPIGRVQNLYVSDIDENRVWIGSESDGDIHCFYTVFAERKDIGKLVVEYEA